MFIVIISDSGGIIIIHLYDFLYSQYNNVVGTFLKHQTKIQLKATQMTIVLKQNNVRSEKSLRFSNVK